MADRHSGGERVILTPRSSGEHVVRSVDTQARAAADIVAHVLTSELGLSAPTEYRLTQRDGYPVLFCILDAANLGTNISRYQNITHQLSTALNGLPVHLSNTSGLRYAVFLRGEPDFPTRIDFPNYELGVIRLGVNRRGTEVSVPIGDFGHWLISGMTRYGKSSFARSLVYQLAHSGGQFVVVDEQNVTIPHMRYSLSTVLFERDTTRFPHVLDVVEAEYDRRVRLFDQLEQQGIFVETLREFNSKWEQQAIPSVQPRYYVVIEEYNALYYALPADTLARLTTLVRKSGKYGIHFILIAQDWTKDQVGPIRGQLSNIVTFRLDRASQSRVVLNQNGAEKLSAPGRALTNNWGELQTYYMDKEQFPAQLLSSMQPDSALRSSHKNNSSTYSNARTPVPEPMQNTRSSYEELVQEHSFDEARTKIAIMLSWGLANGRIAKALGGNYQNRLNQVKAVRQELGA